MKIVIVSGGTGGHIYPGIAVADELKRANPDVEILFFGGAEGLEQELVKKAGYNIVLISARALLRKISYKALSAPFVSLFGFGQSLYLLRKISPDLVFSTGGYVSLPVVLAARILSIPIYIQEQNLLPGLTNRFYARWAKQVFLSFEGSKKYLNGQVTGNPVRRGILEADRESARRELGISADQKVVLVVGGSQGARTINRTVIAALPRLGKDLPVMIVHIIGQRDYSSADDLNYPFYHRVEYEYNMSKLLAAADLAVSRAGATAIAEFTARGLPMFLVPFPYSAEGHQDLNAQAVVSAGAGVLIKNSDFTPERFLSIIEQGNDSLADMAEASRKMAKPQAAADIVKCLIGPDTKSVGSK